MTSLARVNWWTCGEMSPLKTTLLARLTSQTNLESQGGTARQAHHFEGQLCGGLVEDAHVGDVEEAAQADKVLDAVHPLFAQIAGREGLHDAAEVQGEVRDVRAGEAAVDDERVRRLHDLARLAGLEGRRPRLWMHFLFAAHVLMFLSTFPPPHVLEQ